MSLCAGRGLLRRRRFLAGRGLLRCRCFLALLIFRGDLLLLDFTEGRGLGLGDQGRRRIIAGLVSSGAVDGRGLARPLGSVGVAGLTISPLLILFLLLAHDDRICDNGVVAPEDLVADHSIAELEGLGQFFDDSVVALDVHEHIVGALKLFNGVGQGPAAPVLQAVNLPFFACDQRLVPTHHGADLIALVGMDQEHDFIVSQLKNPQ